MAVLGYARVSADGQTVAAQMAQLKAAGAAKVYSETASGAKSDRAVLAKVLRRLGSGDTLVMTRLDRPARSVRDLLNTLHALGERGVAFKSLADAWCDTTTPHGRLMLTSDASLCAPIGAGSPQRWVPVIGLQCIRQLGLIVSKMRVLCRNGPRFTHAFACRPKHFGNF